MCFGLASVRRVRWGNISSELLMCGGGVCSILLLPRDNRCMYMAHVCFMSVVVIVWGLWECLLCSGRVKDSVLSL